VLNKFLTTYNLTRSVTAKAARDANKNWIQIKLIQYYTIA